MAPAFRADSYMLSIVLLVILLENCFLNCHDSRRSFPARVISPLPMALAISDAILLDSSRAFSLSPLTNAFIWESIISPELRVAPV